VAESPNVSKSQGLTTGKMVLIGVLAVTLIGVLYVQYGAKESFDAVPSATEFKHEKAGPNDLQPTTANKASPAPIDAQKELTTDPLGALSDSFDASSWDTPDLSTVVEYDPFALPSAFPRSAAVNDPRLLLGGGSDEADAEKRASELADAVAKLRTELETLKQRGVRIIVKQRDKYVAMIGDRTIHVGDEINGFTVTAIGPDGVRVETKVQQ
jgi:hypothetical protein